MPITVPRASLNQTTDDLKARDALLRGFPEVESVIGKSGRADTPTDPAPLDMVETFVNYRPKELWPRTPDGGLAMFTRPLDLEALLKEADGQPEGKPE
jgi:Cu(I)/Ag(I) efflux system membrane protein CusA/SilA